MTRKGDMDHNVIPVPLLTYPVVLVVEHLRIRVGDLNKVKHNFCSIDLPEGPMPVSSAVEFPLELFDAISH